MNVTNLEIFGCTEKKKKKTKASIFIDSIFDYLIINSYIF